MIEESLNGREVLNFYQTPEEWETVLVGFANSPAFTKALNRFIDHSREGYLPK